MVQGGGEVTGEGLLALTHLEHGSSGLIESTPQQKFLEAGPGRGRVLPAETVASSARWMHSAAAEGADCLLLLPSVDDAGWGLDRASLPRHSRALANSEREVSNKSSKVSRRFGWAC